MPQTFQVLKCFKCSTFQVHLAKKINKWECKLCGEKQSIKRHYGIGTAQECRSHVQKLNTLQGNKYETAKLDEYDSDFESNIQNEIKQCNLKRKSKWLAFIDENDDISDADQLSDTLDIPVQVSKKQKSELCKKKNSNDKEIEPNIFHSICSDKKYQKQEVTMKPNKWSAYIGNDPTKNIPIQVPKTQNHELFENKVDENAKFYGHLITNEKKYPIQYCNSLKSNKWSAYISDVENTPESWCKTSQRHLVDDNEELQLSQISERNNVLNSSKETAVTEISEPKWTQFVTNTTKCDDTGKNIKREKLSLFSLCNDSDLDSILDF